MIKYLLVFIVFITYFTAANAQTHEDSTRNLPADDITKIVIFDRSNIKPHAHTRPKHKAVDSVAKSKLADTVTKHVVADTAAKSTILIKPADSVAKKPVTDSVTKATESVKPAADSVAKVPEVVKPAVDSVAKTPDVAKPAIDSVAKTSAIVKPLVDSAAAKQPAAESVTMSPPERKIVKITTPVKAAKPPPVAVVIKHSPIKTLSDTRYNAYLKGDDLDSMALSAEMNHYPLPDRALKYKVQIGLNPGQITKLKDLASALHRKKVEMGDNIIRNEKMLDSLFHTKQVIDGTLIFYTNRSGLYIGELRGAILMACYETEKILSDKQIKQLEALEKGN